MERKIIATIQQGEYNKKCIWFAIGEKLTI